MRKTDRMILSVIVIAALIAVCFLFADPILGFAK